MKPPNIPSTATTSALSRTAMKNAAKVIPAISPKVVSVPKAGNR